MRRRLGVALAITVVRHWPGCSSRSACQRRQRRKPPQSYVALGDSYTAGPIIPVQQTDPLGLPAVGPQLSPPRRAALGVSNFRDPSCSGAETEDMTMPQGVSPGPNPPQFDSLAADTQLVTVGIGGNDIGFSEIVESCACAHAVRASVPGPLRA